MLPRKYRRDSISTSVVNSKEMYFNVFPIVVPQYKMISYGSSLKLLLRPNAFILVCI